MHSHGLTSSAPVALVKHRAAACCRSGDYALAKACDSKGQGCMALAPPTCAGWCFATSRSTTLQSQSAPFGRWLPATSTLSLHKLCLRSC